MACSFSIQIETAQSDVLSIICFLSLTGCCQCITEQCAMGSHDYSSVSRSRQEDAGPPLTTTYILRDVAVGVSGGVSRKEGCKNAFAERPSPHPPAFCVPVYVYLCLGVCRHMNKCSCVGNLRHELLPCMAAVCARPFTPRTRGTGSSRWLTGGVWGFVDGDGGA